MNISDEKMKGVLTSFFYDLVRDHLPAGVVNKLVQDSLRPVGHYSDEVLAGWAEQKALAVMLNAEYQTEREEEAERLSTGPGEDATYDSSKTRLCEDCSVQMAFFKSNNPQKMDFFRCPNCQSRVMCP